MDSALGDFLSKQLGEDVSEARIHRDGLAQNVTAAHNAAAVTQGEDIFLASDAPALDTADGVGIVAHEAAHVAQNARGVTRNPSPADTDQDATASAVHFGS